MTPSGPIKIVVISDVSLHVTDENRTMKDNGSDLTCRYKQCVIMSGVLYKQLLVYLYHVRIT